VAAARGPAAPPAIVLGADTEVVLDGRLLGKPQDAADAARILRALRDREHQVITGLAVVAAGPDLDPAPETAAVTTRVRMAADEEAANQAKVATRQPLDKAGAYAVQGLGSRLVAAVDGCFTNVVGLPLTTTRVLLTRRGLL
jgi:septum formation protein